MFINQVVLPFFATEKNLSKLTTRVVVSLIQVKGISLQSFWRVPLFPTTKTMEEMKYSMWRTIDPAELHACLSLDRIAWACCNFLTAFRQPPVFVSPSRNVTSMLIKMVDSQSVEPLRGERFKMQAMNRWKSQAKKLHVASAIHNPPNLEFWEMRTASNWNSPVPCLLLQCRHFQLLAPDFIGIFVTLALLVLKFIRSLSLLLFQCLS